MWLFGLGRASVCSYLYGIWRGLGQTTFLGVYGFSGGLRLGGCLGDLGTEGVGGWKFEASQVPGTRRSCGELGPRVTGRKLEVSEAGLQLPMPPNSLDG
jgi:hypothetical protein